MRTTNSELKTGDITEWGVVNRSGVYIDSCSTRNEARLLKNDLNNGRIFATEAPFRIVKTVIVK